MSDPWGVPQHDQAQDSQSSGAGGRQQYPYAAPPQFGAPVPAQYDPNAAPQQPSPQFGAPLPPPYGAPAPGQFGPHAVGAPGPFGYPVTQPEGSNGLALAGAVTSFIPPLGLVLSLVGLTRSKALGGAGRTAATTGIALSLLFGAGWGFVGLEVGGSSAADPGCAPAEAGFRSLTGTINTDDAALTTAGQSGNRTRMSAAEQKYVADVDGTLKIMDHSESIATHADTKAAISRLDTDLTTFLTRFQQIMSGSSTDAAALETSVQAVETHGTALENLCANATDD